MIAILCPVTSRNCENDPPLLKALLPSMTTLQMWQGCKLILGYDDDDPIWSDTKQRWRIKAEWVCLHGLQRKITSIWNALAKAAGEFDYLIPANDDLAFQTSPIPAIDTLKARNGFGTVSFEDGAFPGLPTFYMVGRVHFDIFGCLYPLPWEGAHQDSWIHDVYSPWGASAIDKRIRCHNRIGIAEPRFEYGPLDGYAAAVTAGRRKVNRWLAHRPEIAPVLDDDVLDSTPNIIKK